MLFLSFYSFYSFHLKSLKMCTFYAYKQASQFNLRGTKVVFLYQNQFVSSFSFFPTLFSLLEPCMCITPLFSYLKRQQKALGPRVLLPKALLLFLLVHTFFGFVEKVFQFFSFRMIFCIRRTHVEGVCKMNWWLYKRKK